VASLSVSVLGDAPGHRARRRAQCLHQQGHHLLGRGRQRRRRRLRPTRRAGVPAAITVGATDELDFRTSFSNYGSCVDIFAPGNNIRSADITGIAGDGYRSGTSMAGAYSPAPRPSRWMPNRNWTPAESAQLPRLRRDQAGRTQRRLLRRHHGCAAPHRQRRGSARHRPAVADQRQETSPWAPTALQPIKPISAPQTMSDLRSSRRSRPAAATTRSPPGRTEST
jgi:hypothetical protein